MIERVFASSNDALESMKKTRNIRLMKPELELIRDFWAAPSEARFSETTIAAVTQRTVKTLQCDRWRKCGIPFSKVCGRVLYKKEHVVAWLNSFDVVTSTSQYKSKEANYVF